MNTSFIKQINESLHPVNGYTVSAAVVLNSATAWGHVEGRLLHAVVKINAYLYHDCMCTGIPQSTEKGVDLLTALGIVLNNAEDGLECLCDADDYAIEEARKLLSCIEVIPLEQGSDIYIETMITTDIESVRAITSGAFDKITDILHRPFQHSLTLAGGYKECRNYELTDFIRFVEHVDPDELVSIMDAVSMNKELFKEGLLEDFDERYAPAISAEMDQCTPYEYARKMAGVACYTRVSGTTEKMMELSGSGNHSLTLFLSLEAAANYFHIDEEKKVRGMALAILVDSAVKSQLGATESCCSCAIAAGIASAIGHVYLFGGEEEQMLMAMRNMIGSLYGMKCDCEKESCVRKVGMIAGLAVEAAMAAMSHISIDVWNGGLNGDFLVMMKKLSHMLSKKEKKTGKIVKVEKETFCI